MNCTWQSMSAKPKASINSTASPPPPSHPDMQAAVKVCCETKRCGKAVRGLLPGTLFQTERAGLSTKALSKGELRFWSWKDRKRKFNFWAAGWVFLCTLFYGGYVATRLPEVHNQKSGGESVVETNNRSLEICTRMPHHHSHQQYSTLKSFLDLSVSSPIQCDLSMRSQVKEKTNRKSKGVLIS